MSLKRRREEQEIADEMEEVCDELKKSEQRMKDADRS
jgi:hypothetical protein